MRTLLPYRLSLCFAACTILLTPAGATAQAAARGGAVPELTGTTTAVSAASPVAEGATETGTIAVAAASGTPTGSVQLYVNGALLETLSLTAGKATVSLSTAGITPGKYAVSAKYLGSPTYSASASATTTVTITQPTPTATAVYASPTDIQAGTTATLRARVGRTAAAGTPSGTVTFYAGGSALGTAMLDDGVATLQGGTSGVALGTYSITAKYSGGDGDAASASSAILVSITPAVDVLMQRNDSSRTGIQAYETQLTTANVNSSKFGKIATYPVDGYLYAQPLYVSGYTMSDGAAHNVVYVSTAAGSIYAFDADGKNPASGYLWHISAIPSGEQVVSVADYFGCTNPNPNSTILGTPVIDRGLGVLYFVSKTKAVSGSTTTFYQRIHAISLKDGSEQLNGPTLITASGPGTGDGGTTITFSPLYQNQRSALLEASGVVWVTWASHCDIRPYHGWTMGYSANDLTKQVAAYDNTPNGTDGGIWMVAGGLSSDNDSNIYSAAGNGTFDANTGGPDYGDALQRLAYTPAFLAAAGSLTPADYFDPSDQLNLSDNDLDFGTSDVLLFNDPGSVAPHLAATTDKTGELYLMNRDSLGGYDTGTHGPQSLNGDIQDFATGGDIFANLGYFNHNVYVGANGSPLVAYDFESGNANSPGELNTTPASQTSFKFSSGYSVGGTQPSFSANGTANGIVWALDVSQKPVVLYAFDAGNLATELYSSNQAASSRDAGPPPVKFTLPVIANGKVFVGGQGELVEYGLLP